MNKKITKRFKSLDSDIQEAIKFLINELQVKRVKKYEKEKETYLYKNWWVIWLYEVSYHCSDGTCIYVCSVRLTLRYSTFCAKAQTEINQHQLDSLKIDIS